MNFKIKSKVDWKRSDVDELVLKLHQMVLSEQQDVYDAFIGMGSIKLMPHMRHCSINQGTWSQMDETEKWEKFEEFLQGPKTRPEMSSSQSGNYHVKDPGFKHKPRSSLNPKANKTKTHKQQKITQPKKINLSVKELKAELKARNLDTSGKKADLQKRLENDRKKNLEDMNNSNLSDSSEVDEQDNATSQENDMEGEPETADSSKNLSAFERLQKIIMEKGGLQIKKKIKKNDAQDKKGKGRKRGRPAKSSKDSDGLFYD